MKAYVKARGYHSDDPLSSPVGFAFVLETTDGTTREEIRRIIDLFVRGRRVIVRIDEDWS